MNRKMILIFAVGFALPFAAAFAFILFGGFPASTWDPPLPLEQSLAHFVLHTSMKQKPVTENPPEMAAESLYSATKVYLTNCSVCHGVPTKPESHIAQGMFPKPPQLFLADQSVTDDAETEIYWKIKNGIRLTGMPGFQNSLTPTEIWQVTNLVHQADKLPPEILQALQK